MFRGSLTFASVVSWDWPPMAALFVAVVAVTFFRWRFAVLTAVWGFLFTHEMILL